MVPLMIILAPKWCGWWWMIGIDGNGRDGGVEKRRYSSNLFSFFSLLLSLFFSFFFSFLFPCLFLFLFCFAFVTYFKISKEFIWNKDMEELFRGGLKRVCNVWRNVYMWEECGGDVMDVWVTWECDYHKWGLKQSGVTTWLIWKG